MPRKCCRDLFLTVLEVSDENIGRVEICYFIIHGIFISKDCIEGLRNSLDYLLKCPSSHYSEIIEDTSVFIVQRINVDPISIVLK